MKIYSNYTEKKEKYSIDTQLCLQSKTVSVAELSHFSALQPPLHAESLYCWLLRRAWRYLRGAHRLHHVLGATSTFLQICSWWGNTCPVFFPQSRGWLKSVFKDECQKWKLQQVKSGRITEIQTKRKPSISALNQWSTAQWFPVIFNLLDEYGTICNKYEMYLGYICQAQMCLGYSWFVKLLWTNSLYDSEFWLYWAFWQCKDLGYISRKLMSYFHVLLQRARNGPEGSARSN